MRIRVPLVVLFGLSTALAGAAAPAGEDLAATRSRLQAEYGQKLAELADGCAAQGQPDLARRTRAWWIARDSDKLYFFFPPASFADAEPAESSDGARIWRTKFRALRTAQAEALFNLARRALVAHRPSLTYELLLEAARENPDHEKARQLLGYVRHEGGWRTPFEVRQLSAGKVWHEKFGWLSKGQIDRYEHGERFYRGRWISVADEKKLLSNIAHGWRVESDHYGLATDHSLVEGVQLSRRLERLYTVWQGAFLRYLATESELAKRFDSGMPLARDRRQHQVVCFRDRDEYLAALRPRNPQVDMTLGTYLDTTQTNYFFVGKDEDAGTVYHETTHQLFQETRGVAKRVGRSDNFWIIEGVACYMESVVEHEGYATLGGYNSGRVPNARYRLLRDNYYVPLGELVRYGMETMQHDPQIKSLYGQSAALVTFFMHAEGGHYREPLAEYLIRVYTGRVDLDSLAELTGSNYEELDRQFRLFMQDGQKP